MKILYAILFIILIKNTFYSQNDFGEFSKTEFNVTSHNDSEDMNMFSYLFETKKQLVDFIDLKKGDLVAEIGAGDGVNIGILSMFFDSIKFVAQDIDAKTLKNKTYNKVIKKYQNYSHKTQSNTNTFELVIGTKNTTNLPDNKFDVLFIINSFHDFDKQDEMLDDIYKKLKPNGRFILLEGFSFPNDTQVCPDYGPHVLHTLDFELPRFEKHGFYANKMRSPNLKAVHYGNGLIFVKDKKLTEQFYENKNEIDGLIKQAFRLKQSAIASDSIIAKHITDSVSSKINTIVSVYHEFEVWIKDLGFRHLKKLEYKAGLNVFKANTIFFPDSYQAYYWLGFGYEKNKLYDLAIENYEISLKLNPNNSLCIEKITLINKLKNTNR
ncbi:MAG: Methyltransferase type 11 [Bacteroidetes bacterium]|jgi:SAM-dependent methyltransferase|nr:Methyltransferase type 11 [Bacteroidota bacterium]